MAQANRAPQSHCQIKNIEKEKQDGDALVHRVSLMHCPEGEDIARERKQLDAGSKPDANGSPQGNKEIRTQRTAGSALAGELRKCGVLFRGEGEFVIVGIENGGDTIPLLRRVEGGVGNVVEMNFLTV